MSQSENAILCKQIMRLIEEDRDEISLAIDGELLKKYEELLSKELSSLNSIYYEIEQAYIEI